MDSNSDLKERDDAAVDMRKEDAELERILRDYNNEKSYKNRGRSKEAELLGR